MSVPDYKINYKSDFVLNINGDAGWAVPFCIKFWTGMPSQAYFVGFDGVKYVNCRVGDTPTQLLVMFDDHHLPIGKLKMQIAYHATIEEFPGSVFDEVTNARDVIVTIDGTDYQVMLDFTGEDAPELEFDLPAYANEAERIQNELQRQQNEAARIAAELQREQATAAAVQGAENVNAQLNGTTLTVTNRQGVSTSVNTKGEQGEQGHIGPEGPQGEQGPKGEKGDTGATGPQGIQGPAGPQGQTGVSITDFVKTGETETDTLYDIEFSDDTTKPVAIPKGEKGDQGEQGPEGPQGPMGDVAVITPEQQAAFTMYSTTGQNTDGPMTQKAVTDALNNIAASGVSYDNSQSGLAADNVQGALDGVEESLNIEKITPVTYPSSTTNGVTINFTVTPPEWYSQSQRKLYFVPYTYKDGDYLFVVGNSTNGSYWVFLTSNSHTVGDTTDFCNPNQEYWESAAANTKKVVAIPSDCTYICFNVAYGRSSFLPSEAKIVNRQSVRDIAEDLDTNAAVSKQVPVSPSQLDVIDEQGYVIGRFKDGWFKTRYFDADFESRIDLSRTFLCDVANTGIDVRKINVGQIFRISPDSKILLKNSSSYYGLVAIGRESMMLNWSNDVIFNSGWKKATDIELDNSSYNGDIVFVFFQDFDGGTQMTNEKIADNFSLFITNRREYKYNDSLSACVGAKAVAHRGVHVNDIPENSVDSYRAAIRCGMDMIEADINVTSDGGYIMYHDTSLTSTYVTKADGTSIGSAVAISSKTFDYIRETYRLKSDNPAYRKPLPSLDEYLDICKKGKAYAFPELKGTWTNAQLSDVLQKCKQMLGAGNFCIQGGNAAYLDYIRSLDENVDLCYMYLDIRNTTNTITGQGRFTSHTHAMLTESNMDAALVKDYRANGSEVFDGTLVTPNTFDNVINTYCYPNCIANTCGSNLNGKNGIHISLDTNWYDFKTDGTIANGVLTLETGQYIAYTSPFVFLGSMILNVSYKGSMTIRSQSSDTSLGINKTVTSTEVFSQITERPLVYKNCGSFLITATSNTVIDMIDFQFAEF